MRGRNKNGQFLRNSIRWEEKDNLAYCYVNGELQFFTDKDCSQRLQGRPISKMANGYAATRNDQGKVVLVHRFITNAPDGVLVDHKNRNKKDNRQSNLRFADKSLNTFNTNVRRNNTSGVTGVRFRSDTKRWAAEIKVHYKKIALGCYPTKEAAMKARKDAEVIFFGT